MPKPRAIKKIATIQPLALEAGGLPLVELVEGGRILSSGRGAYARSEPYRKERVEALRSAYAGTSSVKEVRILFAENLRFPGQRDSPQG